MKIINTLRRNWENASRIEKELLGSAVMLTGTTLAIWSLPYYYGELAFGMFGLVLFNDDIGYYVSDYKRKIIKN
jgi:hypothetical protein